MHYKRCFSHRWQYTMHESDIYVTTGPVYAKSKSGSISRLVWLKSGPVHALDGLPPRAHGKQLFCVPDKS